MATLYAFLQEHRRCGELDGGVEDTRVSIRLWRSACCPSGATAPARP
jgi:hypothetical protein